MSSFAHASFSSQRADAMLPRREAQSIIQSIIRASQRVSYAFMVVFTLQLEVQLFRDHSMSQHISSQVAFRTSPAVDY
eukprot:3265634-Pyramimonas_sp.AAC.1